MLIKINLIFQENIDVRKIKIFERIRQVNATKIFVFVF